MHGGAEWDITCISVCISIISYGKPSVLQEICCKRMGKYGGWGDKTKKDLAVA